jgi:hypothetical protein
VDSRSSTSSSRHRALPWAGLLAAALLLALDAGVLGTRGPWAALAGRVRDSGAAPSGVADDRLALREVRSAAPEQPRVFVLGSSRAAAGFDPEVARSAFPGAAFARLGHPGVDPFVMRSLAEEVIASQAAAAVLVLSEIETHRPLRLEPIPGPGASAVSLAAVADLLAETGPGFAWRNRESLYRLVVSSALRGYRYRDVLRHAGPLDLIEFPLASDRLIRPVPAMLGTHAIALGEDFRNPVTPSMRRRLAEALAALPRRWQIAALPEVDILREVTPGIHVDAQLALVRRTVERLSQAGVAVAVVEAPVHPAAAALYPPELASDFRQFGSSLADMPGVVFVPLDAMEPFEEGDFKDLLHTGPQGAEKLTHGIVRGLEALRVGGIDPQGSP